MFSLLHRSASMNCSTRTQRKHQITWGKSQSTFAKGKGLGLIWWMISSGLAYCPGLFVSLQSDRGSMYWALQGGLQQSNPLSEWNKPHAAAFHHTPACLPPAHSRVTRSSRTEPGTVTLRLLRRPAVNQSTSSQQPSKVRLLDGSIS